MTKEDKVRELTKLGKEYAKAGYFNKKDTFYTY